MRMKLTRIKCAAYYLAVFRTTRHKITGDAYLAMFVLNLGAVHSLPA